jgi:Uma2 family endonuclease
MTMLAPKTMSVEAYLEFERTYRHNDIVGNMYCALKPLARVQNHRLTFESIKVPTGDGRYRYPDIALSCTSEISNYLLEHPCFIAEVLSNGTRDTDHGAKLEEYTKLPSMQCYAIVSQNTRQVIVYKRETDRWSFQVLLEQGEIEIPCLDTKLSLDQIYASLEPA